MSNTYTNMTGPELVAAYNKMSAEAVALGLDAYKRPVTKFMDRAAGAKRCAALELVLRSMRPTAHLPETVVKAVAAAPGKGKRATNGHGGTKTEAVAKLLARSSGCTSREVLDLTGWPAVSMPAMAKACGVALRKVKAPGEPTRYFGS